MLVSFGPRSDQYRAYIEDDRTILPPGTTGPVTDVKTFYKQTRDRYFSATYSLVSLLAPLSAFALAVWFIDWLLSLGPGHLLLTATPIPANEPTPKLPFSAFCGTEQQHDPLLNGVFASTFHFAVTHVTLFLVCALALAAAAASIRNVLETHGVFSSRRGGTQVFGWFLAVVVPAGAGYFAFHLASAAVGDRIQGLFERLFPITESSLKDIETCELKALRPLEEQLYLHVGWGALGVSIGVISLILAAALLAWRFETHDINGAWSDSYVLRHKLHSLLTLFFIGSVLLVVTNIALASAMDWTAGVLEVVKTATTPDSITKDASPPTPNGANVSGARTVPKKRPNQNTQAADQTTRPNDRNAKTAEANAKPIAAEFDSLKTLKASILSFAGALGSLILILIFAPALYGVTNEIDIAGKTHASYDTARASPAPPPAATPTTPKIVLATETLADDGRSYGWEIVADSGEERPKPEVESKTQPVKIPDVAGWKTVQEWKEKHGLKLSFTDFTGGFIAALAPLLSGSVIDLTKMTIGAIG